MELFGQRGTVVTAHFTAREAGGEFTAVGVLPAADSGQQLAHTVTVLQHFLLQLAAITHQVARRFVLRGGYVHRVHTVAFAAEPGPQVDDQLRHVKPVGLCAPFLALDWNARGIDDVTFDAASLQSPEDPECVLAGFVAHDDARVVGQCPCLFLGGNQRKHGLQAGGRVGLCHRVNRRSFPMPVM